MTSAPTAVPTPTLITGNEAILVRVTALVQELDQSRRAFSMRQANHTKTEEARAILEQAHAKLTQERATSGTEALVPTSTSPSLGSAPANTTQFNEVVKLNTWLSA